MSLLFVYGTLLRGLVRNDVLKDCEYHGIASLNGKLKALESFPALVNVGCESRVIGEMYNVSSDEIMSVLDNIEGYDPDRDSASLYVRRELPVQSFSTGEWVHAQAYIMLRDVDDYPTIHHGDYRRFIYEKTDQPIYYFGFGSNLDPDRLRERIGGWSGTVKGTLPDFRLTFNKKASFDDCVYANIVTGLDGKDVPLVAYEVSQEAINTLDRYEGEGVDYIRTVLPMRTESGKEQFGWVYIANPDKIIRGGNASDEYREHIVLGYDFHGLGNLETYECKC
jgi:gamma-glutamylcyclotransferase